MGIKIIGSSSCEDCDSWSCDSVGQKTKLPNPDPKNFYIERAFVCKGEVPAVVLMVRYPDCTNFEGIKIMLYLGVDLVTLVNKEELDPHFQESVISPFARFAPTDHGWREACSLAKTLAR